MELGDNLKKSSLQGGRSHFRLKKCAWLTRYSNDISINNVIAAVNVGYYPLALGYLYTIRKINCLRSLIGFLQAC